MYRMPTVNQTWIAYPKVNDNCYHAPNYLVCTTYQTLVILMNGYYPIIETLVLRLTDWPNFASSESLFHRQARIPSQSH